MPESEVDLAQLFNTVYEALKGEKNSLNEADHYNHNHGDHMVENFRVITEAMEQKRGAPPAEQMAFASDQLDQSLNFGSAKIYSKGLARAANQLQGQQAVTAENAVSLVQLLLSGAEDEPLAEPETSSRAAGGTPLCGSLLTAGSAYVQAKQEGDSPLEALMKAVMAGSQMKESSHQSQSGQIVGGTLINVLSNLLGRKKPKSKPKPRSKPKQESKRKSKPKAESKPKPKPKVESKPKSKPKPKSRPKSTPESKPKTRPKRKSAS